jgi:hypothetical protein
MEKTIQIYRDFYTKKWCGEVTSLDQKIVFASFYCAEIGGLLDSIADYMEAHEDNKEQE